MKKYLAVLSVLLACASAQAAVFTFESATLGPLGQLGGTTISAQQFSGAKFTIAEAAQVDYVGVHASTTFADGTIFEAIVSLPGDLTSLPTGNPFAVGEVVGSVVLDIPQAGSAFYTGALSLTLPAGNYALVVGSGALGATGQAALAGGGVSEDSNILQWQSPFGGAWHNAGNPDQCLAINMTPVPEPATWGMLSGLGLLGFGVLRRHFRVA